MKKISISKQLLDVCSDIKLGCIQYKTKVEKKNQELWKEIEIISNDIIKEFSIESIGNEKNIMAARALYKGIGKDPYRYRISSEALIRRIVQGKGMYQINNVVDCNNLISISTKLSVGSYDCDKLGEAIEFRVGNKEESYKGIGKETINVEKLPVFADENGAYGSPTSDSEKSMITQSSKNILTILISFDKDFDMDNEIIKAKMLLEKYANAEDIETYISTAENNK
ncbi:MAG: hypothetical protein J6J36_07240 [Clostridia bacterium]|nr:hypothetical protein [Clostridia bacterium]